MPEAPYAPVVWHHTCMVLAWVLWILLVCVCVCLTTCSGLPAVFHSNGDGDDSVWNSVKWL
jgi:hypothetical protein